MNAGSALEQSNDVMAALEALSTRLADDDRGAVDKARALIDELKGLINTLDGQLAAMRWLAQKQFRPKTEKVAPGQLALDLLGFLLQAKGQSAADGAASTDAPAEPESTTPTKQPRERRTSKLHLLPVEVVRKEIAASERTCATCSNVKAEMGHDSTKHLVYVPPRLFVREEQLVKYACRCCGDGVVIAEATPKLIPGSPVTSSVLAHLAVSRLVDAMPIERTAKQWARHGADVATGRLYDWQARSAEEVAFLHPIAHRDLLTSALTSFDDTIMPAKVQGHANGTQRGRLWLYLGDIDRVAYCEFTPDWKGCHPQKVLAGFNGLLQSDGYGGIARMFAGPDGPTKVGCNDHARRKWVEALKLGDKRAASVVALYGELYAIEAEAKHLAHDERLRVRQTRSVAVWARLAAEVARLEHVVDPKSPIGKACTYFRRQNEALSAFLHNGILPISNAHVERLLRAVALFRKNSLFVGSLEAGNRYAVLLTLAINCAIVGANPFDYFTDLFDHVAAGWPASKAAHLMPRAWLAAKQPTQDAQLDGLG